MKTLYLLGIEQDLSVMSEVFYARLRYCYVDFASVPPNKTEIVADVQSVSASYRSTAFNPTAIIEAEAALKSLLLAELTSRHTFDDVKQLDNMKGDYIHFPVMLRGKV